MDAQSAARAEQVAALAEQAAALAEQVADLTMQAVALQRELQWYRTHSPVHPPVAPPVAPVAEPAWWVLLSLRPPRACAPPHAFSPAWGSV